MRCARVGEAEWIGRTPRYLLAHCDVLVDGAAGGGLGCVILRAAEGFCVLLEVLLYAEKPLVTSLHSVCNLTHMQDFPSPNKCGPNR